MIYAYHKLIKLDGRHQLAQGCDKWEKKIRNLCLYKIDCMVYSVRIEGSFYYKVKVRKANLLLLERSRKSDKIFEWYSAEAENDFNELTCS